MGLSLYLEHTVGPGCGSASGWKFGSPDPHPHHIKIRIRLRVVSRFRIRINGCGSTTLLCTIIIVLNCFFRFAGLDHNPDEKHSSSHDIQHCPSRTSGKSPAAEMIFLTQFLFYPISSVLDIIIYSFILVFLGIFWFCGTNPYWERIVVYGGPLRIPWKP